MRQLRVLFAALLSFVVVVSVHAQWTATRATRVAQGVRYVNGDTAAVVSVVTPEVIRVRMTSGNVRDHSYAVVGQAVDAAATVTLADGQGAISTSALRVSISQAP